VFLGSLYILNSKCPFLLQTIRCKKFIDELISFSIVSAKFGCNVLNSARTWSTCVTFESCRISMSSTYCNKFAGFSFHDGTLLHSQFNTQLLITVHNSSSLLTHV
jgi:hypothetical protein